MKKVILSAIVTFISMGLFAQTGTPQRDTTRIKWGKTTRIWIFHVPPTTDKHNDSITTEKQAPEKREFIHWAGVDIGVCMLTTIDNKFKIADDLDTTMMNNFLNLNYGKSLYFSLNAIQKSFRLYKNYISLVTGLGMEWDSYNFKKNITLNADAPYISASNTAVAPDSIKYFKNKINITYLKLPLLLELNTNSSNPNKSFHIAGGLEFAYKIGSITKQKYNSGGYTLSIKRRDDYHLADFKYSVVARIGYGKYLTLFTNYSITHLFENNRGPSIFMLTSGVTVDF